MQIISVTCRGACSCRGATFRGILRDMVCAFLDHKLERLLVFNGHTGNNGQIDQVLREIRRSGG